MMNKITNYWLKHSEYDLKTAKAMLKSCRYLYVTFMCQQCIEKILKGIITTISDKTPPRIHNLKRLLELAKLEDKISEEQLNLCINLTPFCIITRYAEEQQKLIKLTNKKLAEEYFKKTQELYKCLKNLIKQNKK